MPYSRKLIFGLGSGRCGTRSLAAWLNNQAGARVFHELVGPSVPWTNGDAVVWEVIRNFPTDAGLRFVGDVASYYLPYVEKILSIHPSSRFVCLKRAREETVSSFVAKTPRKNHWVEHDGLRWKRTAWDHCFPKYTVSTKEEAIGLYWDEYYQRAAELQSRYPFSFQVFPTGALNTLDGQRAILDFLCVPEDDRRYAVGIRLNVTKSRGIRRLLRHLSDLLPARWSPCAESLTPATPRGSQLLRSG